MLSGDYAQFAHKESFTQIRLRYSCANKSYEAKYRAYIYLKGMRQSYSLH